LTTHHSQKDAHHSKNRVTTTAPAERSFVVTKTRKKMKEITLSTNMHCGSCVAKVGKVLDAEPKIHHWKADVTLSNKPVIVYGDVTEHEVAALIQQAGFSVGTEEPAACDMPAKKEETKKAGFWSDKKTWKRASFNTFNCLIGCAIGDFAMIIYLQVYHPQTPMWLQMLLAILAGLTTSVALETTIMHYREKFNWKAAFQMAVSMSFLSMVAMEIAMNATDFMLTGGKAQLSSPLYWLAFIPAAVAGFLTPLPYNYYQLKKHNRSCH
jgi:cation transport ATPase